MCIQFDVFVQAIFVAEGEWREFGIPSGDMLGSGARVRGQSLTKYGRYPIHKEGKIRYSAQHRAKAFDF
jgi:hypothetical protein